MSETQLRCFDRGMTDWPDCGHQWHEGVCNAPSLIAALIAARAEAAGLRSLLLAIAGDQQHYCKHSIAADELLGTRYGTALAPSVRP